MPNSYTVVNRDRTQSNMDLGKPVLERYRPFLVMGLVGSVIGMSGLFSLALKEWDWFGVRYLVLAFAAIGVVCLVVFSMGRLVVNYWDDRSLGGIQSDLVGVEPPARFARTSFWGFLLIALWLCCLATGSGLLSREIMSVLRTEITLR